MLTGNPAFFEYEDRHILLAASGSPYTGCTTCEIQFFRKTVSSSTFSDVDSRPLRIQFSASNKTVWTCNPIPHDGCVCFRFDGCSLAPRNHLLRGSPPSKVACSLVSILYWHTLLVLSASLDPHITGRHPFPPISVPCFQQLPAFVGLFCLEWIR